MKSKGTTMMPSETLVRALEAKEFHEGWWKDDLTLGLFKQQTIDNVAVLFSDRDDEASFNEYLQEMEWCEFNESSDHVVGHLSGEDYDVDFRFLRDPDDAGFRIETMVLDPVYSRIHSALLDQYGQGAIAQGSYKPNDTNTLAAYQDENAALMGCGFNVVECFQSTYGPYTYFICPALPSLEYGYLKVRLNTRDAQ